MFTSDENFSRDEFGNEKQTCWDCDASLSKFGCGEMAPILLIPQLACFLTLWGLSLFDFAFIYHKKKSFPY